MYIIVQRMQRQSDKLVSQAIKNAQEQVAMAAKDNEVETEMDSCSKSMTVKMKEPSDSSSEDGQDQHCAKRNLESNKSKKIIAY